MSRFFVMSELNASLDQHLDRLERALRRRDRSIEIDPMAEEVVEATTEVTAATPQTRRTMDYRLRYGQDYRTKSALKKRKFLKVHGLTETL
jgi:hypothetical protein